VKPTRTDHVSDEELARRGLSRETELRLRADGRWFDGRQPIAHPGIARAFSRWIERAPTGRYVLRNDLHYVYVQVEGAPLHALRVESTDDGLDLILAGGERQRLRPDSLREAGDGVLYADGRDGTWAVRLGPAAVLDLAAFLVDEDGEVLLEVGETRSPIPQVEDPLSSRSRPDPC
jgi:uncharacterized protein